MTPLLICGAAALVVSLYLVGRVAWSRGVKSVMLPPGRDCPGYCGYLGIEYKPGVSMGRQIRARYEELRFDRHQIVSWLRDQADGWIRLADQKGSAGEWCRRHATVIRTMAQQIEAEAHWATDHECAPPWEAV